MEDGHREAAEEGADLGLGQGSYDAPEAAVQPWMSVWRWIGAQSVGSCSRLASMRRGDVGHVADPAWIESMQAAPVLPPWDHNPRVPTTGVVLAVVAVALAACTNSGSATSPPLSSSVPTSSTTPSAQPSIPAELRGQWRTTLTDGEDVTLTLTDTGYQVKRGPETVHGGLSVTDDQISFLRSSACDGVGRYRWSLAGPRLTFVLMAPDECPARAGFLMGQSYTLAGG